MLYSYSCMWLVVGVVACWIQCMSIFRTLCRGETKNGYIYICSLALLTFALVNQIDGWLVFMRYDELREVTVRRAGKQHVHNVPALKFDERYSYVSIRGIPCNWNFVITPWPETRDCIYPYNINKYIKNLFDREQHHYRRYHHSTTSSRTK